MEHWRLTRHHSQEGAFLHFCHPTGCWVGERLSAAAGTRLSLALPWATGSWDLRPPTLAKRWLCRVCSKLGCMAKGSGICRDLRVVSHQVTRFWSQFTETSVSEPPGMLCRWGCRGDAGRYTVLGLIGLPWISKHLPICVMADYYCCYCSHSEFF